MASPRGVCASKEVLSSCSWVVLDTGELRGPLCLPGFVLKVCMAYSNQR